MNVRERERCYQFYYIVKDPEMKHNIYTRSSKFHTRITKYFFFFINSQLYKMENL